MNLLRTGVLVATAALAIVAQTATFDKITLKRTPKVGDAIQYAVKGTLQVQGQDVQLTGRETDKVTKADADGYTVEATSSDMKVLVGGQEQPMPDQGETTTTTQKLSGEITAITDPTEGTDSRRLAQIIQFYFPANPVDTGEKWSYEGKADPKLGNVPFKVTYTLTGEEKVGAIDTAKVDADAMETSGEHPIKLTGTYWISKADGSLVKYSLKATSLPISGQSVDGTLEQTRVD